MDTKIDFLYLSEKDMIEAGVLDAGSCVDTVGEVMALLSKGDYLMGGKDHNEHGLQLIFPEKSPIKDFPLEDSRDRRFMSMPAYLGGKFHIAGEKWYGSNGRNAAKGLPRSILMVTLNDVETGQPLAYMSANLLSAMRTGAMPGLAAMHLARKDAKVLSLLGAGVVNKTSLLAIMAKIPSIKEVKILGSSAKSRTAVELAAFARERYPELDIKICADMHEAVVDADIISEAVSAPHLEWPTIDYRDIKKGCLVISSGTVNIDYEYMKHNVTKIVDNLGMYEEYINVYQEYEEDGKPKSMGIPGMAYVLMMQEGAIARADIQHLGNIERGIEPGRSSEDEVIVISLGGMPILDVGWGYECYKKALEKGIGTQLNLWDTPFLS